MHTPCCQQDSRSRRCMLQCTPPSTAPSSSRTGLLDTVNSPPHLTSCTARGCMGTMFPSRYQAGIGSQRDTRPQCRCTTRWDSSIPPRLTNAANIAIRSQAYEMTSPVSLHPRSWRPVPQNVSHGTQLLVVQRCWHTFSLRRRRRSNRAIVSRLARAGALWRSEACIASECAGSTCPQQRLHNEKHDNWRLFCHKMSLRCGVSSTHRSCM